MKENPRAAKVADFKERLERAQVAILAEYKGLTVKELEGLRHDLRAKGAQLRIIKNTLAKRALAEADLPDFEDMLKGQVAFVFGYEDAVGGPQVAKGFARKHDQFKIIAGIFEGERVEAKIIEKLAWCRQYRRNCLVHCRRWLRIKKKQLPSRRMRRTDIYCFCHSRRRCG